MEDASAPSHRLEAEVYKALYETGLPVEVRVEPLEEFQKRRTWVNSLERTVAEKGQVLYGFSERGSAGVA